MSSRRVAVGLVVLAATVAAVPAAAAPHDAAAPRTRAQVRAAILEVVGEDHGGRPASGTAATEAQPAGEAPSATAAGTSTRAVVADRTGEPEVLDARGDLVGAAYDLSAPEVATLSVTLRSGEDPTASARWRDGRSSIVWAVDDDGDGVEDSYAFAYVLADGRLIGEVVDAADQRWRCSGTLRWDGAATLSVTVPSSCVAQPGASGAQSPGPSDSRAFAFVYYDPTPSDPDAPLSRDWAPEPGPWTAPVARRAAAHPARPATTDGTRFTVGGALATGAAERTVTLLSGGAHGLLCDIRGDGVRSPVIVTSGRWETFRDGASRPETRFVFGQVGDVPLCGDWDGDGTETAAVYRAGQWHRRPTVTDPTPPVLSYGAATDVPVVGDWDGDGVDTPGVRRGSRWYLWEPEGDTRFDYGAASDVPVVGDWDADGRDTVGVVRDDAWMVRNANGGGDQHWAWRFGGAGTRPLVAR